MLMREQAASPTASPTRSKARQVAVRSIVEQLEYCTESRAAFRIFSTFTGGVLWESGQTMGVTARPDMHEVGLTDFKISNAYEMGSVLGTGSAGIVQEACLKSAYRGDKKGAGRKRVAIKILSKRSPWWKGGGERRKLTTLREVELLHTMSAEQVEGVADVYAAIETDWYIYIVMELCTGGDLLQVCCRHRFYGYAEIC